MSNASLIDQQGVDNKPKSPPFSKHTTLLLFTINAYLGGLSVSSKNPNKVNLIELYNNLVLLVVFLS